MNEQAIQRAIIEWLLWHGYMVIRVNQGAFMPEDRGRKTGDGRRRYVRFAYWRMLGHDESSAGISDILAVRDGRLVAIECKTPARRNRVTAAQRAFLAAVEAAGGIAIVADGVDAIERALT